MVLLIYTQWSCSIVVLIHIVNAYNLCHAQLSYPYSYSCSIFVVSSSDGKPYSKTELTANLRRKKTKLNEVQNFNLLTPAESFNNSTTDHGILLQLNCRITFDSVPDNLHLDLMKYG